MSQSTMHRQSSRQLDRPSPSGLADVIDIILDKGLVIDLYVRVSLVGIELLTIDARIVIASVDTYLRFASAVNRLDLQEANDSVGLPELVGDLTEKGAKGKTSGALEGAKDKISGLLGGGDDEDDDDENDDQKEHQKRKSSSSSRKRSSSSRSSEE